MLSCFRYWYFVLSRFTIRNALLNLSLKKLNLGIAISHGTGALTCLPMTSRLVPVFFCVLQPGSKNFPAFFSLFLLKVSKLKYFNKNCCIANECLSCWCIVSNTFDYYQFRIAVVYCITVSYHLPVSFCLTPFHLQTSELAQLALADLRTAVLILCPWYFWHQCGRVKTMWKLTTPATSAQFITR